VRPLDIERRKADRLHRLAATHELLQRVRAEHARAVDAAVEACSLGEVGKVLGMSRSGVKHHRDRLRAGARQQPIGRNE
jgi:hypothetical protein